MSGSLSGSYSNSVTWDECSPGSTGTGQESLTLSATISPGKPVPFTGGVALSGKMTGGGHWNVSGSYQPRQEAPTGGLACGGQQAVKCGGGVLRGGGGGGGFPVLPP